ncbi:LOW QUALITY PROTEIN: uncharacterized protein LOC142362528 [Opisthocomus hoazin]|uniref:LOW QUALITY PROTEIN: uncharacterized protein LOC142362528 n=1 Tax=Opisthocomus hoazin TaxID=30419 RepID=UPI003F53AA96
MARSAAPGLPLPTAALLRDCGCRGPPDPEGYSSSSPAPSPDSCGLSSPAAARGPCHGPAVPRPRRGPGGRKGVRAAWRGGPRQSASEREKLRMRRLARALLRLRHYLPPALAPAGQSLTKIETLRLATRYIAHLSALLGLGQETPARRRGAAPRHCPLCPQGLGCCQPPHPPRHPPAPAPRDASPAGTAGWGSPPTAGTPLELRGAPGVGTEGWGSPPYSPAVGTPLEMSGVPDMGTGAWGSPPYPPVAGTPPELHGALDSEASSWLSPPGCAGAGAPPDLPGDPLLDAGLMLPELLDAGTVTQELSADLLSLLEALLPPQPQD